MAIDRTDVPAEVADSAVRNCAVCGQAVAYWATTSNQVQLPTWGTWHGSDYRCAQHGLAAAARAQLWLDADDLTDDQRDAATQLDSDAFEVADAGTFFADGWNVAKVDEARKALR